MKQKKLSQISRTKTVATVGPACSTVEGLVELINRGVDVFRLNMAHGTREDHLMVVANIRQACEQLETSKAILVDLAGPKIRLGRLVQDPLTVDCDSPVSFVRGTESQSPFELTCTYAALVDEVEVGHDIVLADGTIRLRAIEKQPDRIVCEVQDGGVLRSRQGVNLPATHLSIPALGDIDRDNAIWAAEQDVDYVSLSFVRNATEMQQLTELLNEHNSSASVIAKIEKREALDNLESIIQVADAIMVARGDLGVEIDIAKTPLAQKRIIKTCLKYRKPVIVATQMLESMHTSKQPTRAEVSDVANAILDGADACMLSGETAIGEYPAESVSMMQRIMLETEQMFRGRSSRLSGLEETGSMEITEAVMFGSAQIARQLGAKLVVLASETGESALIKSKQRDFIPTICFTSNPKAQRRMCLYWGIVPVKVDGFGSPHEARQFVDDWAKSVAEAQSGDPIVMVTDTEWVAGVHDNILVGNIS